MLKLYGFKKVNKVARGHTRDLRILWALEEMQLPYELVGMDHPAKELETDTFGKVNPFHQLPAIDDEGVLLSESGAILIYLAKKAGKLIPLDPEEEAQVLLWCFTALNSVEIPLMNILMNDWVEDDKDSKYRKFLVDWGSRHLSNLERWLEGREFVATDSFTIADILMAHVLTGVKDESLLQPYEVVRAYRDRCLKRKAWITTLERYNKNVEPYL